MRLVLYYSTVPTQHYNRYRLVAFRGWPLGIFLDRRLINFWKQNLERGQAFKITWVVGVHDLCTLRTLVEILNMLCYTLKGNIFLNYVTISKKKNQNKTEGSDSFLVTNEFSLSN